MYFGFHEEGDRCPELKCSGALDFPPVENCSCHLSAPCYEHISQKLTCNECGWEENAPDHVYVPVAPGLSIREDRPRPLDSTKIEWRSKLHSGCSMIKEGVYPEGTTSAEVRAVVNGTFGGHFESFGHGKFKFIAYTD